MESRPGPPGAIGLTTGQCRRYGTQARDRGALQEGQARGSRARKGDTEMPSAHGPVPKLSGDIRPLIPKLGLRQYWYPAVAARKVGSRKPVKVSMLGEDLCLFRG